MRGSVKRFIYDLVERAVKTFAQALAAVLSANAVAFGDVDWGYSFSVAGLAALISVLTSIASYEFGESGTASLVKGEDK